MSSVSRRTPVDFLLRIENAPAEAGAGMKLHHGIFQQVFHIAAENTGQLVENDCLRLVNAIDPLFGRVDGFQIGPKIFKKDFNCLKGMEFI